LYYTNKQLPAPLQPRIEHLNETKLVGKNLQMSFATNQTPALWRSFMPHRKLIQHTVGNNLWGVQFYPPYFFKDFNPETPFIKWAAVEVNSYKDITEGLETLTLEEGLYAVFLYKGLPGEAEETYMQIFGLWLPNSEYELDTRAHFEIMGAKYQNGHPDSEEELWIPIKRRTK
jgi:AraC family transcriptional regulator